MDTSELGPLLGSAPNLGCWKSYSVRTHAEVRLGHKGQGRQRENQPARLPADATDAQSQSKQRRGAAEARKYAVDGRHKKNERPRETTTRRKPARADARAALDETARRPRIVGSPVAIIRKAARVGDAAVSEERYAP